MAPNRKPIGFYLSSGWLFVCLFMSLFGGILPLPKWDDYDFEYTGAGLFTPGHIFGTDFDGADLLSQIVHGTRNSILKPLQPKSQKR